MCRISILLLSLVFFFSCKKSGSTGNGQPNDDSLPPAITAIGTPVGSPVTKTIGTGGGTISSPDGRIELTIPAGALSVNTDISIQPITNECPGGRGLAYSLLPNGTKFAVPVTYTFHYSDSDMNGTSPYLYCLAYQDSLREWRANFLKDVDTVAKTIKFDILHFTDFGAFPELAILPDKDDLGPGDRTTLKFVVVVRPPQIDGDTPPGQDELPPIPHTYLVRNNLVADWTVVGGAANGTISGTGNTVTYLAPSKISQDRRVSVSVAFLKKIVTWSRRSAIMTINKDINFVTLYLHPNLSFDLKMDCTVYNVSGIYEDKYHDAATMHVDVKSANVAISNTVNQAPTVSPTSGTAFDGTKAEWVPDGVGVINITDAFGFVVANPGSPTTVDLIFTQTGVVAPSWKYTFKDGTTSMFTGDLIPGSVRAAQFILKDSEQVFDPLIGYDGQGVILIRVTPVH